jgi:hypothetical protein
VHDGDSASVSASKSVDVAPVHLDRRERATLGEHIGDRAVAGPELDERMPRPLAHEIGDPPRDAGVAEEVLTVFMPAISRKARLV